MYKLLLNGFAIECNTLAELRAAVGEFAGQIKSVEEVGATLAKVPAARAPSPKSSGPDKGWRMARWFGKRKGIKPMVARAELAEMRRTDFPTYQKLENEFIEAGD